MKDLKPIKPTEHPKKPGFFARIINKMDESMKEKADTKAKNNPCCQDDNNGKGGKCC